MDMESNEVLVPGLIHFIIQQCRLSPCAFRWPSRKHPFGADVEAPTPKVRDKNNNSPFHMIAVSQRGNNIIMQSFYLKMDAVAWVCFVPSSIADDHSNREWSHQRRYPTIFEIRKRKGKNWCSKQPSAASRCRCCSATRIAGIDSTPICDVTVRDLSGQKEMVQ